MEIPDEMFMQLCSDVAAMKDSFERQEKRLFGNGQPGELQKLDAKCETARAETRNLSAEVAAKMNFSRGFIAAIATPGILGLLLSIWHHFFPPK